MSNNTDDTDDEWLARAGFQNAADVAAFIAASGLPVYDMSTETDAEYGRMDVTVTVSVPLRQRFGETDHEWSPDDHDHDDMWVEDLADHVKERQR